MINNSNMVISLTCSKNEDDIIESFVRINSRLVDLFVFIDDSTDRTRDILNKLSQEGFSIRLMSHQTGENRYRQSALLTAARRVLMQEFPSAIIVPLDCDEFPEYTKSELFEALNKLPEMHVPAFGWRTYVPVDNGFPASCGLADGFVARDPEGRQYYKVVVPPFFPADTIIDEGSHRLATAEGRFLPMVDTLLKLAHFPVRSAAQIAIKNITAVIKVARTTIKRPGEGGHIYTTFNSLVKSNFSLNSINPTQLGLEYANQQAPNGSSKSSMPPPFEKCNLIYTQTSEVAFNSFLGDQLLKVLLDPIRPDSAEEIRIALGRHP